MCLDARPHSSGGCELQRLIKILVGTKETAADLNALEDRIDNGQLESAAGQTDQYDRAGSLYGPERLLDRRRSGREHYSGIHTAVLLLQGAAGALRRDGDLRSAFRGDSQFLLRDIHGSYEDSALRCVLLRQMAESTHAEDPQQLSGGQPAFAHRAVRRPSRATDRGGFGRVQPSRYFRQVLCPYYGERGQCSVNGI